MSSRCFVIDGSSCGCGGSGLLVTGPGLIATGSGLIATGGTDTILVWNIVADSTKCSGLALYSFNTKTRKHMLKSGRAYKKAYAASDTVCRLDLTWRMGYME